MAVLVCGVFVVVMFAELSYEKLCCSADFGAFIQKAYFFRSELSYKKLPFLEMMLTELSFEKLPFLQMMLTELSCGKLCCIDDFGAFIRKSVFMVVLCAIVVVLYIYTRLFQIVVHAHR